MKDIKIVDDVMDEFVNVFESKQALIRFLEMDHVDIVDGESMESIYEDGDSGCGGGDCGE